MSDEFTRFAGAALERLGATLHPRKGLTGVIDFKLPNDDPPLEGVFVGSTTAHRVSCVVYHGEPVDEAVRPQLLLLCHLINPTLDLGQMEFTHDGGRLVSKVTQCAYPGEPCNARLIGECVETALRLMRENRHQIDQVMRGDVTAANAFHTRNLGDIMGMARTMEPESGVDRRCE